MAVLASTTEGGYASQVSLLDIININPPYIVYNEMGNYFTPRDGQWTISSVEVFFGKYVHGAASTPLTCQIYSTADLNRGVPTALVATSTTTITPSDLAATGWTWETSAWQTFDFDDVVCDKLKTYVVTVKCLDETPYDEDIAAVWVFSAPGTTHVPNFVYGKSNYNIYSSSWNVLAGGGCIHYRVNGTELALPEKAITPGPTNANEAVELDQEDLTWVDGGLGEANAATTFNVYYGTTSGALTLVSSGQAAGVATNLFTVWGVEYGSPYEYAVTRYWRIDSTNASGTTTGDEWSFTTLSEGYVPPYPPPRPDPYDPDVGGGGSYATNLLVIGHKVLYYRET